MFLEKLPRTILLVSILVIPCCAPKRIPAPPASVANPDEPLAQLKLTDLDGKPLNLADFAGKPVFLNFWATWCAPCVSEMGSIEQASKQFKNDIVFLAVSNESPALIRSYVRKNNFTFSFARLEGSYLDAYVVALPTTMLLDRKGNLVEDIEGFRNWSSANSMEKLNALVRG
jgi:thiol-disulfide isomerase/thioredoxin